MWDVVFWHGTDRSTRDKAQAWWDSPGRKNSQTIGDKYATFRIFAVEGATP
jgi:hypothetical protein